MEYRGESSTAQAKGPSQRLAEESLKLQDDQAKAASPTQLIEEPSKNVWGYLPIPPYKNVLKEVLEITETPDSKADCDRKAQSPEISGKPVQDSCSVKLSRLYPEVKDSVVQVFTRTSKQPSFGSATLICENNCYYVTNQHVVGDSDQLGIFSSDHRNIRYGKVLYRDPENDLALVAPPDPVTSALKIGNLPSVGDRLFTLGHSLGSPYEVISAGKVNAVNKDFWYKDPDGSVGKYKGLISSDVKVVQGNSGGPEFNDKGELVGIKAIAKGEESGSIPVSVVMEMVKSYEAGKK